MEEKRKLIKIIKNWLNNDAKDLSIEELKLIIHICNGGGSTEIHQSFKMKPGPEIQGSIRISVIEDEIDILNDSTNLVDFDYTLQGYELWVREEDEQKAYNYLGIVSSNRSYKSIR